MSDPAAPAASPTRPPEAAAALGGRDAHSAATAAAAAAQGGVAPNEHTYTSLIDACVKRGELARAEKVPIQGRRACG